ncbi:MAG: RNA-binding protein [Alphaproteobacteria bacterium]|nr:RNA-binding protein [Alphaproteobacteria bacterium]
MTPAAQNSHDQDLTATTDEVETDAGPASASARSGGRFASANDAPTANGRRCIATMERRDPASMIRFVLSPAAEVTPDIAGRLPGRGAWVSASREAVDLAVKKGAFSRAFQAQAKAPSGLADMVEGLLARRVLDMLGLVKRSGDLILGFEQVRDAVRTARPACLIEASDGSEDGRGKLLGLARAIYAESGREPPVAGCFSAEEMGMALGRGRVIHACLKQGRFAQAWMGELARLGGFRRVWLDDRPDAAANARRSRSGAHGPDVNS